MPVSNLVVGHYRLSHKLLNFLWEIVFKKVISGLLTHV